MSSRKCHSILEPLEASELGVAEPEADFSWQERAEAAQAQLREREEELEAALTDREAANQRLRSQLAQREEEVTGLMAEVSKLRAMLSSQQCANCKGAETAVDSWLKEKMKRGVLTERSLSSRQANRRKSM